MERLREIYERNKDLDHIFMAKYEKNEPMYFEKNCIDFLVEFGEFVNETKCFKYWSIKEPKMDDVYEEFADCITMILTMYYVLNLEIERILRYCEIDSDKRVQLNMDAATMELIAQGYGWSIMPSSGIWSVRHYLDNVRLLNLPEFKFSRKIYLNYQDSSFKSLADLIEKQTKEAIQMRLLPEMVKVDSIFQKAFILLD